MKILSVPPRPTKGPRPPSGPRAWFARTGTIAENDGAIWELRRDADLYTPDDSLDPAYVVDIDGTLAHIPEGGRSPYDGTRVGEDILDTAVARVVNLLAETNHIVVMSGRDEQYRDVTEKWLTDNNVHWDVLFMRPAGDRRKDHIIKRELFDANVRGVWNVLGVFDDRNRVVQMWRSLGLKCFHVQEGDF